MPALLLPGSEQRMQRSTSSLERYGASRRSGVLGSLLQKAASQDQGPTSTESTQKVRVSMHVGFPVIRQRNLSRT